MAKYIHSKAIDSICLEYSEDHAKYTIGNIVEVADQLISDRTWYYKITKVLAVFSEVQNEGFVILYNGVAVNKGDFKVKRNPKFLGFSEDDVLFFISRNENNPTQDELDSAIDKLSVIGV